VSHPVILRTLQEGALLHIGDNVGISGATICASKKITIGDNVMLGSNVSIMDTDFHAINPDNRRHNHDSSQIKNKEITIEANVFIGTNSVILKGTFIGKNSIIGAGSVVSGKIPENSIAVGNPAKVIRNL
jgi:acetyltransferase-like isoleucine patch superfamily enzyme